MLVDDIIYTASEKMKANMEKKYYYGIECDLDCICEYIISHFLVSEGQDVCAPTDLETCTTTCTTFTFNQGLDAYNICTFTITQG